jgi:hypothetical protein
MNKENIHCLSSGSLVRWSKTKNLHILSSQSNLLRNLQIPNHTLGQNEFVKFSSPRVERKMETISRNPQTEIFEGYFSSILTHTHSLMQNFDDLLHNQPDISLSMRNFEVMWIFSMREVYRLSEETLFHAVTYMDMYFQKQPVTPSELALLSTTCLLISSKNNEIYQLKIIEQRKRAFNRDDILEMENSILVALDFKLAVPSLYELYRSSEIQYQLLEDKIVPARKDVIVKILQLCLCDQTMMEYGYNMCALAAIVLFSKYRAVSNKPISNEL